MKAAEIPVDKLLPPLMTPNGDVRQEILFNSHNFSSWLGLQMEEKLKSFPEWQESHPILLGSWARNELCPRSDLDILFCGDPEKVKTLVRHLNEQGYKIRSRMPEDPNDWTVNVESFDVLSLLKARPLTTYGAEKLFEQQKRILQNRKTYGKKLLNDVREERKKRSTRFDSITNFLEPNIKYGPGSLRDLEQGLQIYEIFADKIPSPWHSLNVLKYYKSYFLTIRQKLHLLGMGDVLVSTAQFELAQWMGFKSHKDFMRDFQSGVSRVEFYSSWLLEAALSPEKKVTKVENHSFRKAEDLSKALYEDSSSLMQKKVREKLNDFFAAQKEKQDAPVRGKVLERMLDPETSDAVLVAHFRSRLIDKLLPEIKRLVGYVQHDQYHRFAADAHIMQACREFKRIYHKVKMLGPLKFSWQKLKPMDWKILTWACLYHDLAKGLDHGHDHSAAGVEIVRRDFKLYGFSKEFTDQVAWLVENHLELSQAAFRKNPKSPKVWQELREKGVEGQALHRLALFTAIDIRATNPDAWNDWKARLLSELVSSLESKSAQNYYDFTEQTKKKRLKLKFSAEEIMDPLLLDSIASSVLVDDLKKAEKAEGNLKPLVVKNRKNEVWIRFHVHHDRVGILAECVQQLYSLGIQVRHAAIQTLPGIGVYDWFQVISTKNFKILSKWLENAEISPLKLPEVNFENIEIISSDDQEWVLSFKGIDQPGLLAAASMALAQQGLGIQSARVHTWGRQIEDVFIVKPSKEINLQDTLTKLRLRFLKSSR